MPRYRFRWENLDARLLDALSGFADGSDDPVAALRAKFGARPGPESIAAAWKPIREQWLAGNAVRALGRVVQRLKKLGLGEGGADVSTVDGALEYLRSCRNASTLRTVVLDELLRGPARRVSRR